LDDLTDGLGYRAVKPKLNFDLTVTTYTIPLEVNTSILVLWFLNLDLGVGADIAFGKNDTSIKMNSPVYKDGQYKGSLLVSAGGDMAPTIFNPKVMTSLGLKLGPVVIDIPVTYYFTNGAGFSAGFTLGVVW
jgi:hypothetical protein